MEEFFFFTFHLLPCVQCWEFIQRGSRKPPSQDYSVKEKISCNAALFDVQVLQVPLLRKIQLLIKSKESRGEGFLAKAFSEDLY